MEMNSIEFPEDSESSDEDYDPGKCPQEVVSEVESDGDPEDPVVEEEDLPNRGKKRRKPTTKRKKKSKTVTIDADNADVEDQKPPVQELTEEEKKKQADDLWASFKKDTGFKSRSSNSRQIVKNKSEEINAAKSELPTNKQEKIKITQIVEFAGEEVKIEKEVPVNSAEAKFFNNKPMSSNVPTKGRTKGGLSGIASVLNRLGKKQKISTLEKSKLDWDKFKKEENIEAELQTYNKGKDGYLERQDFLQRTDLRRFEIEKEVRTIERNKRMNEL